MTSQITFLQPGDLLFQQRPGIACCGEAIRQVCTGIDGFLIDHVGLYVDSGHVIEAVSPQVHCIPVKDFFAGSVTDAAGNPKVLACRLKPEWQSCVPRAIRKASEWVGMPYNRDYGQRKDSYYCSELIVDAFCHANDGVYLFEETPMNFLDPETGELLDFWIRYYREMGRDVPQGEPGSHPAQLSRAECLMPLFSFGCFA